ncbi:MAG: nicotinate (nicotinamide) nucleotide adenylyltransferase [Rhizobacter sp.]|nr:nicotinate (nicotinamide) nucleotide adenylyltransferase [Chlorobiales bacterium]
MKIALYGGSFDPPHYGHFAVAALAREFITPDKLILSVSQNPLKAVQATPSRHRLEMTRRFAEDLAATCTAAEQIEVSDWEAMQGTPSYTVDSLRRLKSIYPQAMLYLCIGEDNLRVFDQWRSADEILNLAQLIVFTRQSRTNADAPYPISSEQFTRIHLDFAVAATGIRTAIAAAPDAPESYRFVPSPVAHYIQQHRLYRAT